MARVSRKQGPVTSSGKCKYGKVKTPGPRKDLCRMKPRPKKAV